MENKKIRLHPFKNGIEDKSTNLYPETSIDAVQGLDNALNDKQDTLNQSQLDAVNSGVTANKVAGYDTLQGQIDSKQGELNPSEKSAVDSGITSDKVAQYDAYANEIAGKQNTISDLDTIRSGAEAGASAVQPSDLEEELENYLSKDDYLKNAKYDKIEKEIPGEIVDGETYELSMEYDMSKFDLPSEYEPPLVLYGDLGDIPFILIYFQGIGYNDDENAYSYIDIGDGYHWYIMGDEPVLYEGEPLTITIDESRINEDKKDILSIILNIQPTIITEDQSLENKFNEELKDKTYDYVTTNVPVDGHTYKLKENANINSLLSDEGSSVTLILYRNESYRIEYIKSSSKGGSSMYNLNVYDSNDEIIDTYIIAIGAGGEHYVNQWQNGTEVLTLDFLYNEETVNPLYKDYFNQFLDVQESSSRSLEQKFNEVENEPLKDKLYEKGEKYYQPLFTPTDEAADLIWDKGGNPNNPHLVYDDNNLIIETYLNSYSFQLFQYYRFTIGNDIYQGSSDYPDYWEHTSDNWSSRDYINTQEDLPKITFDKQYITSGDEELFNGLIYSKYANITLGQKFNEVESPLKDKTYEEISQELVEGEDYPLLEEYSNDFFTKYEDLFTTGAGKPIYSTGFGVKIDLVKISMGIEIPFILFNNADMNICVAYVKMPEGVVGVNDGWYEAEWDNELDGWNLITPPTPASAPTLISLNILFIVEGEEETLKDILGLGTIKKSLEQKFDEVEPPYTITDYTEDNGVLTSITVKSKETGEPTTLVVGGGNQRYIHYIHLRGSASYNTQINFMIENDSSEEFTPTTLINYLKENGFNGFEHCIGTYGKTYSQQTGNILIQYIRYGLGGTSPSQYDALFYGYYTETSPYYVEFSYSKDWITLTDNVIPK